MLKITLKSGINPLRWYTSLKGLEIYVEDDLLQKSDSYRIIAFGEIYHNRILPKSDCKVLKNYRNGFLITQGFRNGKTYVYLVIRSEIVYSSFNRDEALRFMHLPRWFRPGEYNIEE